MNAVAHHEIKKTSLVRDVRSFFDRFHFWLYQPTNFLKSLAVLAVVQVFSSGIWPVWMLVDLLLYAGLADLRFRLPLRMPKDVGGLDRSDIIEVEKETPKLFGLYRKRETLRLAQPAGGLLYLGHQRSLDRWLHGIELWGTSSDVRTHMTLAGTTGAGKTKTLLGIIFNALCWGSGAFMADGKAMTDVAYEVWCMARYFNREDDVLFLSFLTGGTDPFDVIAQRTGKKAHVYKAFQSNSMQPMAEGEASFLLQMLASLLPKASGEGQQWQSKALNMLDAVIRVLCYKRAMGELDTSLPMIRHYLALDNLVQFYIEGRDGKLPELAWLPIKAYFETSLPGFSPGLAEQPDQWSPEVRNQHGYLTGQFSRMLAMMMDSYGYIFGDRFAEIDMTDVMLNNRILVALIPSMEKSEEEAAALGKLTLACVRLMMAKNLGHQLEGTKAEIVDVKATNTPFPTPIITDELGYYFAPGMAVMYAQARSLNFFMVAAFQDLQALKRGEGAQEVASLIANTKFKYCLALEDPDETFELFRKAGGQASVSVVSGHDSSDSLLGTNWSAQSGTRIEIRDRIDILELKSLEAGQGMMIFKDMVVRTASFYVSDEYTSSKVVKARINRFLQVPAPAYENLPDGLQAMEGQSRLKRVAEREIAGALVRGKPFYPDINDPILDAVIAAADHMNSLTHQHLTANDRAVVLYEAARRAMRRVRSEGGTGFFHSEVEQSAGSLFDDEPEELVPGEYEDDSAD
jgi:intracellular multiplication protein IcmO